VVYYNYQEGNLGRKKELKMTVKKTIFTATYTQNDRNAVHGKITFRFVGKGMKQEYRTLEEIKEAIKEANIKDVIEYKIYKHEVEEIETI
jgi:ribosomal protein L2